MRDPSEWHLAPHVSQAKYRLLSGIRGPDSPYYEGYLSPPLGILKSLFTSRIRGIIFRVGCPGIRTESPFTVNDMMVLKDTLMALPNWQDHRHFIYHLYDSIRTVPDHPVWDGFGPEIVEVLDLFSSSGTVR